MSEVAKRHGVSEQSKRARHKKFGDMCTVDVKRLKQLEQENSRLKRIVAERNLEIDVMKEIESPRVSRRLLPLRGWSHEQTTKVSLGTAGASDAHVLRVV